MDLIDLEKELGIFSITQKTMQDTASLFGETGSKTDDKKHKNSETNK